jgi:hypothetical protein
MGSTEELTKKQGEDGFSFAVEGGLMSRLIEAIIDAAAISAFLWTVWICSALLSGAA